MSAGAESLPQPLASRNTSRFRRWLKRILWSVAFVFGAVAAFALWVWTACFADPPELSQRPAVMDLAKVVTADGVEHLGKSWFLEQPGRSLLHVEGDPFTMGYANATLTAKFLEIQEGSLLATVREHFPSTLGFLGVATVVLVNNRNLPDFVSRDLQLEVLGLSQAGSDPFPAYGPRYHRILNYHAAHDIAHWVWDRPVVGCTAFAARGGRTASGSLIVARNFDFEAGRHFDENKIIGRYVPDSGFAFLSVAWPGMAGVVTGLNAEKIYCSLNGAHSSDKRNIGTPVAFVVRDVLQHAATIEAAVEIIRRAEVFVSDSYLIADGKSGEAVVVEKSPEHCAVRRMADDLLLSTNHFECPEFQADSGNREQMREGTTVARHSRLAELLASGDSRIDVSAAVRILRDRFGPSGRTLELGHRAAINGLIATHAVVADVTRGILWVSRGPHSLGAFDAYSLDRFGTPAAPGVEADALLGDGAYARWSVASGEIAAAVAAFKKERKLAPRTREALTRGLSELPGSPEGLYVRAELLLEEGDQDQALSEYRKALAAEPPFQVDREAIQRAIRKIEGTPKR